MGVEELKGSRVLVTGAKGFIGSAVCRLLAGIGAEVHGVGRSVVQGIDDIVSYVPVNLTDAEATMSHVNKVAPHSIIHLAGCSVARRELNWVQATFEANVLTTVNILSAAQQSGVGKTIIAGSLEQPDESGANSVPSSPYAASKWAASGYGRMFHAVYGLKVVTARVFMVYGPGQQELQKMIPYICLSCRDEQSPALMAGDRLVDWIYVDDVAEGLARLLVTGPEDGGLIDLGTGILTTTGDVASAICSIAGNKVEPEFGAVPNRSMEQVRKAEINKMRDALNWEPKVALKVGLEKTYRWYQEHGRDINVDKEM